jgi:protein O-GlcNAc transferase
MSVQMSKFRKFLDQAIGFHNQGKLEEAEKLYQRILIAIPGQFDALHLSGVIAAQRGQYERAHRLISKALTTNNRSAEAFSNYGNVLMKLRRVDEALASYDKALAINPKYADALNNRGNALRKLNRPEEALACYETALAINPKYTDALNNRGSALQELRRYEEAFASYDKAIEINPTFVDAICNRALTLAQLKRHLEAIATYDKALSIRPDFVDALANRGLALEELKRYEEAISSYQKALAIKPDQDIALTGLADAVCSICDWSSAASLSSELKAHVTEHKSTVTPFTLLCYSDDPSLQLQCAKNFIQDKIPVPPPPLWDGKAHNRDRIRLVYVSNDFREHATAYLIAELLELHDRSRFEVLGISFGLDDSSKMRARLIGAFDLFFDVQMKSDREIARLVYEQRADIVIDLKGYTQDSRPGIFAHRPAPIQVNYLGYPGTMGAKFIDYVLADCTVLPLDQQPFFTENIVHLPECYQVNDSKRTISTQGLTRIDAGLPDHGFVFCCFNNNYKITALVFEVWMRLLLKVKGSVLWLLRDNVKAEQNLRRQASLRGVDPSRLVFANRLRLEDHLARHSLADLFLDTLPVNAHTTASDALWTGLPLLTCCGQTFAGRVATSLLNAIGASELITNSPEDYEAKALKLALDPILLQSLRKKLKDNKTVYPLFDTDRFRGHIESAYTKMWEIWKRGERPRSFSVGQLSD